MAILNTPFSKNQTEYRLPPEGLKTTAISSHHLLSLIILKRLHIYIPKKWLTVTLFYNKQIEHCNQK